MTSLTSRANIVLGVALLMAPVMAIGAGGASGAGATTPTRILTCTQKLASKPSTFTLSCADAGAGWTGMTWSVWKASSATGHGVLRQNNCVPDCVAGKFISYRTTVSLSRVVATKKYGELFSRAVFHYSVNGKATSEVFDLAD